MEFKVGETYRYKRDGRVVIIIQISEKRKRIEVSDLDDSKDNVHLKRWNPFWLNFEDLY